MKYADLKAQLAEATALLEDALHQGASDELDDGPGEPWLDTGAISTYQLIGDFLVLHAGWERHPQGKPGGRRQWYRPPQERS